MIAPGITVVVHSGGGNPVTTILAVLGVVLALASLAWQAVSFRLSGSRVGVELRTGLKNEIAAVTIPWSPPADQVDHLRAQGFTDRVLAVHVRNSGRSPTSVVSVALLYANGAVYSEMAVDPPLPFRLEAESEQTWFFDAEKIEGYANAMGKALVSGAPLTVRGSATLGGGKKPVVSANELASTRS
jgi:hypothetical protein